MTKKQPGARATPKRAGPEDKLELNPSGSIDLIAAGGVHKLRRPRIGELREFLAAIGDISIAERAGLALRDEHPEEAAAAATAVDRALLDWWRNVVETLTDGLSQLAADDDELPPWLLNRPLLTDLRNHWSTVPWGPGGSPQDKAAREASSILQSVGGLPGLASLASPQPQS